MVLQAIVLLILITSRGVVGMPATAHESEEENTLVVHMEENSFTPQQIEITTGTKVIFENTSATPHWPASDIHPTHTLYPGSGIEKCGTDQAATIFDACGPIPPGEIYAFTFQEEGTWRFHDHLAAQIVGKVVVVSPAPHEKVTRLQKTLSRIQEFLTTLINKASNALLGKKAIQNYSAVITGENREEQDETAEKYVGLVNDRDPRTALDTLREDMKSNDTILNGCHPIVHEIGHAAYEKYDDFGTAMTYRDELCNSGYIHGVIEERFTHQQSLEEVLTTTCDEYGETKYSAWQCYHGLGHGLMFATTNDVPQSVRMCEKLPTSFAVSSCVNGVFMENFNVDGKFHTSPFLKPDDPLYPCEEQSSRNTDACVLYAPAYYLEINKNQYEKALAWCGGMAKKYREKCAEGVGLETMEEHLNDPQMVEEICMSTNNDLRTHCVRGMANLLINHYGSLDEPHAVCESLNTTNKTVCNNMVESVTYLFQ